MTELPDIMRKHPRTKIFAYVHSHPNDQVMGVAIDANTGYVIEAVILPTRQRVMLGLGIGNDQANAHHAYRRRYPNGYILEWTDDPETDKRLERLKRKLTEASTEARERSTPEPARETHAPAPDKQENPMPPADTGQLTAELIQSGVEKQRAVISEQPAASNSDTEQGNTSPTKPNPGGFY